MKKTPSPIIIRPGHIRKQTSPGGRTTQNHDEDNNHRSKNIVLSYILSAAKRFGGVFSPSFFHHKKAYSKSSRDQIISTLRHYEAGENSYFLNSCAARDSRTPSRSSHRTYDLFPDVGGEKFQSSLALEEIYKATGNFSPANKIGEDGFGTVYLAKLKNGTLVAVKRAKRETYDQLLVAEFKNEIVALSKIEHLNLVKFYGYLEHRDERLIVIEYISNGTLREHLDGTHGSGLEIGERLDIAIDVAHAVTYLHTYTDPPIVHRDIKASNILITKKHRAKVSDFGFARLASEEDHGATHISTQIKGTAGYLDPEYLRTYQLSEKSDIYSFGVLLVEMMTGRHPIESKRSLDERLTVRWALRRLEDGEVCVAMDPRLPRNVASIEAVEKVLKLARQCLDPSRLSRPSMRKCAEIYIMGNSKTIYRENITVGRYARTSRPNVFGIEESDSLMMYVSACVMFAFHVRLNIYLVEKLEIMRLRDNSCISYRGRE